VSVNGGASTVPVVLPEKLRQAAASNGRHKEIRWRGQLDTRLAISNKRLREHFRWDMTGRIADETADSGGVETTVRNRNVPTSDLFVDHSGAAAKFKRDRIDAGMRLDGKGGFWCVAGWPAMEM
jgi:hypothetical protein